MIRTRALAAAASLAALLLAAPLAHADEASCKANKNITGSFFSGRTTKTFEVYPDLSVQAAFSKLSMSLMEQGFDIKKDREDGSISWNETTDGKIIATTTFIITKEGTGSKINAIRATASLSGNLNPAKTPIAALCTALSALDTSS